MNFEEAYQKVQEGTASDEEATFVAREIVNARKVSAILDLPAEQESILAPADTAEVQRARKSYNRKSLIRTIIIVVCSLIVLAGLVCGTIFGTAIYSAKKSDTLSRDEAVVIAEDYLREYNASDTDYIVHDVDRHLRIGSSLTESVHVYEVELRDGHMEYEVEVNAKSGYTVVTDVDDRDD